MRRLKMLLMSAVLAVAMLIALSGPAMAHDFCCVGDRIIGDDDVRLVVLLDEDKLDKFEDNLDELRDDLDDL